MSDATCLEAKSGERLEYVGGAVTLNQYLASARRTSGAKALFQLGCYSRHIFITYRESAYNRSSLAAASLALDHHVEATFLHGNSSLVAGRGNGLAGKLLSVGIAKESPEGIAPVAAIHSESGLVSCATTSESRGIVR